MAVAPANLRPTLFFFFVFFLVLRSVHSMSEAEALINFKNSFSDSQALKNWVPNSVPCEKGKRWEGVVCNNGGFVNGLRLEGMGLSGKIDVNPLVELKGLRSFSVKNNSLSGSIPEMNRIGFLRNLYLSENQFSGEIPPDFFQKMRSLKKLWLSDNKFTGQIPSQIPNVVELHLENNQFSGVIPNLSKTTSLLQFNVSNNKLEGEIPQGLSRFNESSFLGNSGLCGGNLGTSCDKLVESPKPIENTEQNDKKSNKSSHSLKIAAIVVASSIVLLTLIALLFLRSRRKKKKEGILNTARQEEAVEVQVLPQVKKEEGNLSRKSSHCSSSRRGSNRGGGGVGELVMVNDEKGVFGMLDLMKAAAQVLGNGGFGSSYKAVMGNGMTVVVKRTRDMNLLGKDGFDAEMRKLGSVRHRNLLTPLAYHFRKDEKLVVFEFVPKGSLLFLLHGDRGPSHEELDWPTRLKIVQGIVEGMLYLHTQLASCVLPHGNLKSSNILLGPNYEPMLVDFGFFPLINPPNLTQALFAYKTPEASQEGQVSPKSDVFCLGVVILEILSGKFPSQYHHNGNNGGTDVVEWAASAISEGRVLEMLDPQLENSKDSLAEMERLLLVGVACTASNPEERLDMTEAFRRIEEIQIEGVQGSSAQGQNEWRSRTSFGSNSIGSRSEHRDSDSFDIS
ncbi:pollen receptor-like kinase 3 [Senna tora]|uniref:Pollen receptor-like kinase 3 n=1 Tax=Senna tora TaxID=362788 RepID=A0A834XFQ8_9FABA|nr:pollen receptor-like kinase 3 [Senna tora]